MQKETAKSEDLNEVVNGTLRADLMHEKELSIRLKEELKQYEYERVRIMARI